MSPRCSLEYLPDGEVQPFSDDTIQCASEILKLAEEAFQKEQGNSTPQNALRDLDVIIIDADKTRLLKPHNTVPYDKSNPDSQYPVGFRIPPETIPSDLMAKFCIQRAQRFALGSLIYKIVTGRSPFAHLDGSEVQNNFQNGVFPKDVMKLPLDLAIAVLRLWSAEFDQEFDQKKSGEKNPSEKNPGEKNPGEKNPGEKNPGEKNPGEMKKSGNGKMIALGLGIAGAATLVCPVLGVVGFSSIGPVGGSLAALWQSSIGLVQAGGVFAGCQSIAMGGAAGTILAVQGVGCGIAGVATLAELKKNSTEEEFRDHIWRLFLMVVRKAIEE